MKSPLWWVVVWRNEIDEAECPALPASWPNYSGGLVSKVINKENVSIMGIWAFGSTKHDSEYWVLEKQSSQDPEFFLP